MNGVAENPLDVRHSNIFFVAGWFGETCRLGLVLLLLWMLAACAPESGESRPADDAQLAALPTQTGYFMNIDNLSIRGESTSESHREWIELQSLSTGARHDGGPGRSSATSGRLILDGLQVSKLFDRSTPELRRGITAGTIFGEIRIEQVSSCGKSLHTPLVITLNTARIEAVEASLADGDLPREALRFEYSRIETLVTPVDSACRPLPPVFSTSEGSLLAL